MLSIYDYRFQCGQYDGANGALAQVGDTPLDTNGDPQEPSSRTLRYFTVGMPPPSVGADNVHELQYLPGGSKFDLLPSSPSGADICLRLLCSLAVPPSALLLAPPLCREGRLERWRLPW
jgi:hypothetical protein